MKTKFFLLVFLLFGSAMTVNASTLQVNISDIDKLSADIWSYQMNFDITGTGNKNTIDVMFDETNQHQWKINSSISVLNWDLAFNVNNFGQLVVLATDNDLGNGKSPLVDGNLFTVSYGNDVILNLSFLSFLSSYDLTTEFDVLNGRTLPLTYGSGDHVLNLNTAVPIPATLMLFATGLTGLFGIRRKMK